MLNGGAGADRLDGGGNIDTITYAGSGSGVTVDLMGTGSGGDAQGDTYISIEHVIGSGHADAITGNASDNSIVAGDGADSLVGGDGNDTLDGGNGDDSLVGGNGFDSLIGGAGTDTVDYSASTQFIAMNLMAAGLNGDAVGDTYSGIENAIGTNFADQITGTTGDNVLTGLSGNDTLDGGDGNDTLIGGVGSDVLTGGAGTDTVDYATSAAITLNLHSGSNGGGDAAGDTFSSIERFLGSGGGDTFFMSANAEHIDGRGGVDRIQYQDSNAAVTVDLGAGTGSGGHAAGDTYVSIEYVVGSSFADTLIGSGGDDTLIGDGGADVLNGGTAGTDTVMYTGTGNLTINLRGGSSSVGDAQGDTYVSIERFFTTSGNDTFLMGSGATHVDGGAGHDVVSYASSGEVALNLATGGTFGEAVGDTYAGIEEVIGSGFDDVIDGTGANETLRGGGGMDTLRGGGGADTLWGGSREDRLEGGAGDDVIEDESGVASSDDTLFGGDGNDTLYSRGGTDQLFGEADADTLIVDGSLLGLGMIANGGAGFDTLQITGLASSESNLLASASNFEILDFMQSGVSMNLNLSAAEIATLTGQSQGASNELRIYIDGNDTVDRTTPGGGSIVTTANFGGDSGATLYSYRDGSNNEVARLILDTTL